LPVRSIQVADGGQEFSLQSIISSSHVWPNANQRINFLDAFD